MEKKIFALVDCNSFYASCEKMSLWRPDLIKKPVVVLSNNDGCVVAMSGEAKKAGIKRGTPFHEAADLMREKNVSYFSSNYTLYIDMSNRIMDNLSKYSPDIEPYSIDEAFLDFTGIECDFTKYAKKIKKEIFQHTGIPVSVGIGSTKTLAKLANTIGKKYKCYNGIFNIINHPNIEKIFSSFGVNDIWGIGMQHTKKLHRHNINTIHDFVHLDEYWVKKNMNITGLHTLLELKGNSCIDLKNVPDKKQILNSRSFGAPVASLKELKEAAAYHAMAGAENLRMQGSLCRYICVFIATNPFKKTPQYSNAKLINLPCETDYTPELIDAAHRALKEIYKKGYEYKRAGVLLGGLVSAKDRQNGLFEESGIVHGKRKIINAVDKINQKFGSDSLRTGAYQHAKAWEMKRQFKSQDYTTDWRDIPTVYAR